MNAGLREQRAQARVRRRAERLEAREKRTRPVRKAYDDPTGEEMFGHEVPQSDDVLKRNARGHTFSPKTTLGFKKDNDDKIAAWHKERGVEWSPTKSNTTSGPMPGTAEERRQRATKLGLKNTQLKAQNEIAEEHDNELSSSGTAILPEERKVDWLTQEAERRRNAKISANVNRIAERKNGHLKKESGMPEYDPSVSMEDNIRRMAGVISEEEMMQEYKENSKKFGAEYAQTVLDERKAAAEKVDAQFNNKIDTQAQEEYRKETADQVAYENIDAQREQGLKEQKEREAQEAELKRRAKARADEEAYAKEMEQTKYNIMRDNAGKFLKSFAQAGVDNIDKINTAGWDMAGNMVKAMFTRPEALSSASRVIGSAMSMNEAVGKMAEDTSKRYGIAVQADPELIKDTIKYKAYKRAKEADGQVMGNAMRVLDNSLKSMGVQDITQLDSTQLGDYSDILTGEMERIRDVLNADAKVRQTARGAGLREEMKGLISDVKNYIGHDKTSYIDPNWNGKLSGEDRALLTKTYNVLVDHMKELTKQSSALSREEKARIAEARVKQKEKRKEQYKVSPIGWALEAISPGFTMDVNSNTGLPTRVEDWGKLERYIASELAAAEQSGNFIRPREDYEKALEYIKDVRQKTHEARHKDTVAIYEASPIGWALEVAFPSYRTPVSEATGLPTRLSDYKWLSTTIRAMMHEDKVSGKFGHSPQEYQDALDMLDRSKEAILEQRATSKVQSYGILAEDLVRQVPAAAKGIINAAKTGRWSHGVDASLRFLEEKINFIKADPKNAGGRYLNDPEYKVAYCMYNSALLSKQVTQLMDRIMPVMVDQLVEGTDEEKKAAKVQQEQDLLRLSQILYEMRDVLPVDANMAKKVDLVAPNGEDAEFKLRKIHEEMGHISDRYKAMSAGDNSTAEVKDPENINDEVDDTEAGANDAAESDDNGFNTEALVKLFIFTNDDGKMDLLNSGVATLNLMDFMNKRGIKMTPAAARKIVDEIYQDLAINIESISGGEEEEVKVPEIVMTPQGPEIQNGGGREQEQIHTEVPPKGRAKQSSHALVDMMKEFEGKSLGDKYGMVADISQQLKNLLGDDYKTYFLTDENGLLKIAGNGNNEGKIITLEPIGKVNRAIKTKGGFKASPLTRLMWKKTEPRGRKEKTISESDKKLKEYLDNSDLLNFAKITDDDQLYLPLDALYSPSFIENMQGAIGLLGEKPVDSFVRGLKAAGIPLESVDRPMIKKFISNLRMAGEKAKARRYSELPDNVTSKFLENWTDGDLTDLIAGYFSNDWADPKKLGLRNRLHDEVYGEFNTDGYRKYIQDIDAKIPDQADAKLKGLFAKAYVDKMLEGYVKSIESGDEASKEKLGRFLDSAFAIWGDYIRGGKDPKNSLADLKKVYSITQPGEEINQRGRLAFTNYITGQKEDLRSDDQEYIDRYQGFENKLREYLDTIPYTPSQGTPLDGKGDTVLPGRSEEEFDNDESYNDQKYSDEDIDDVKDWIGDNLARAENINDADFDNIMKSMYEYTPDWKRNLSVPAKAAIIGFSGEDPIPENMINVVENIIGIANHLYPEQGSDREEVKPPEQDNGRGSNPGGKPKGADEDITEDKITKWVKKYNTRTLGKDKDFMRKLESYTGYKKDDLSNEQLAAIYGYARSIKDWDTKVKKNISKIYRHFIESEDDDDDDNIFNAV